MSAHELTFYSWPDGFSGSCTCGWLSPVLDGTAEVAAEHETHEGGQQS